MFPVSREKLASSDFPLITEGYSDLHYDVIPILYTGFNRYGTRVLGSSVDEDYESGTARHFRILLTQEEYASFLDRHISYRSLLSAAQSVFVLDYNMSDELQTMYLISTIDIPEDYLPTEESFAPSEFGVERDRIHRIALNGSWTLEDLSDFPESYKQVYSFLYALRPDAVTSRAADAFTAHPWAGGYSAVNFYNQLYALLPREDRPSVHRIVYASPGYIELTLASSVALTIRSQIRHLVFDYMGVERLYSVTHSELKRRGLLGYDAPARDIAWEHDSDFVYNALARMTKVIGLEDREALDRLTGNALVSLKIVLSFYRRLRQLAQYELQNKLTL